jgi:hypothetical protein
VGDGARIDPTPLVIGIGIALLGCLLFLDNLAVFPLGVRPVRLWPAIVIAIGAAKLVEQWCCMCAGCALCGSASGKHWKV